MTINIFRLRLALLFSIGAFFPLNHAHSQCPGSALQTYPLPNTPTSIEKGDFTGDGYVDLAVRMRNRVNILTNSGTGNGVLSLTTPFNTPDGLTKPTTGDFDQDGDLDIAIAEDVTPPFVLAVYKNNGTGSFGPPANYTLSGEPSYVSSADLNGDSFPDLIVTLTGVEVMLNNGDGTFATGVPYGPFDQGAKIALPADMNGDRHIDIIVGANRWWLTLLKNNGDGTFVSQLAYPRILGTLLDHMAVGDLDGDNDPDLALLHSPSDDVIILKNDGSGTFGNEQRFPTESQQLNFVSIGFLNNDCFPDLAFAHAANSVTYWIYNDGTGAFGPPDSGVVFSGNSQNVIADFDCNGYGDIAFCPLTSNDVRVLARNQACQPLTCQIDPDGDEIPTTCDQCPSDPFKGSPGACGCGLVDLNTDGDSEADCNETCDSDPLKLEPGICGCGVPDIDSDGDSTMDCQDACPFDPLKIVPGVCGCGTPDTDSDLDGRLYCMDNCPQHANPGQQDCNNDGTGDACTIAQCGGVVDCSDCNRNLIPDSCDISSGHSQDANQNGRPDECRVTLRNRWREWWDRRFRHAPIPLPERDPRGPTPF